MRARDKARILICAVALSLLTGARQLQPVDPDHPTLADNEGLLYLLTVSWYSNLSFNIRDGKGQYTTPKFGDGGDFRFLALPAGRYYLYGALSPPNRNWIWQSPKKQRASYSFDIEPGQVNFIGIIHLDGKKLRIYDRQEAIRPFLEEKYPQLLTDYPFIYTGPAAGPE